MYALSPASRELSRRESLTARFPSLSLWESSREAGERAHLLRSYFFNTFRISEKLRTMRNPADS